ncbi:hypothetical protein GJAV_G00210770 [Gymnothorax javanicus]|nr:hypothetical protein GJAV_G00210770 [Gymnothorax javanicus]
MLWSSLLFGLMLATSQAQMVTLSSVATSQWTTSRNGEPDNPSLLQRPQIHYCRSPDMETFTCWWRFPSNSSHSKGITYTMTYSVGEGPKRECPDYVTGGSNSCYFDSSHTQVWEIYCMNVVAHTRHGNHPSDEHCLDVADIVETDPPSNLTYWLTNRTSEGSGSSVMVSWQFPNGVDVHMGWVTLVFELQYRRKSEPHNWKVKGALREPRLELLDLPAGSYEVRVRCKSHNSRLWSRWSGLLTVNIPGHQISDKLLAIILVTGIGIMAVLLIAFGIIPHGKRIKAFLLPPIPKPRIRGIDPTLLKSGRMDEVTHLFKSFHGYSPPQYIAERWLHVTAEEGPPPKGSPQVAAAEESQKAGGFTPITQRLISSETQPMQQGQSPYCELPSQAPGPQPLGGPTLAWSSAGPQRSELLAVVNLGNAVLPNLTPDFYTCVNEVNLSGAVQLVPCEPAHIRATPFLQMMDSSEREGKYWQKAEQGESPVDPSLVSLGGMIGHVEGNGGTVCPKPKYDISCSYRPYPVTVQKEFEELKPCRGPSAAHS